MGSSFSLNNIPVSFADRIEVYKGVVPVGFGTDAIGGVINIAVSYTHLNTFVPGRNLFFLSIAAVYARERGINHIVTGVSQTDFSGYPDCRDAFIKSLNVTLNLAMDEQFVLHTPLMWIDKAETWALADELGAVSYTHLDVYKRQVYDRSCLHSHLSKR